MVWSGVVWRVVYGVVWCAVCAVVCIAWWVLCAGGCAALRSGVVWRGVVWCGVVFCMVCGVMLLCFIVLWCGVPVFLLLFYLVSTPLEKIALPVHLLRQVPRAHFLKFFFRRFFGCVFVAFSARFWYQNGSKNAPKIIIFTVFLWTNFAIVF